MINPPPTQEISYQNRNKIEKLLFYVAESVQITLK
jgi:hypothetical protein